LDCGSKCDDTGHLDMTAADHLRDKIAARGQWCCIAINIAIRMALDKADQRANHASS